jgi:hypothetical protein
VARGGAFRKALDFERSIDSPLVHQWMLGNLGRAGYGATLEGTWPYACEFSKLSFALHHHALLIAEKLADCSPASFGRRRLL